MRLYKRGPYWWARWTEGGVTIRRTTRCTTKDAARIIVSRWERERADPVYAASQSAAFGVEAGMFLQQCEEGVRTGRISPHTAKMYEQKAGTLVRILGADSKIALFGGDTFVEYIEARKADRLHHAQKPITDSTLYKEWVAFAAILRNAWRAGRFSRDPKSLKPPHFGPSYRPRNVALTWPEVRGLLRVMPEARRGPVAYALATGARRKEVFAAQPEDVRGHMVHLRGTKTDAAPRTIPVPTPFRPLFALVGPLPFRPWPNARRGLLRACKRAGVPACTWNDLRRTFASLLVQGGVAPHLVAKLLGHTTTAMVDLVYGRQTTDSLEELVEAQLCASGVPASKGTRSRRGARGDT